MAKAAVVGTGIIPFGKHEEKSVVDMATEASLLALKDAGVRPAQVEACFFSNVFGARLFGDVTIGQNVFWELGINKIPVVNVENVCTSGSTAFYLAYNMVAAGQIDVALVAGAEKLFVPNLGLLNSGE